MRTVLHLRSLAVLSTALLLASPVVQAPTLTAQTTCTFKLGFKALRDLIPDIVGDCLEDEHFNPGNSNAEQRTTGGLLVWRKADNWTAFTDGATTWINGPEGLVSRPNAGPFFSWEAATPAAAFVPVPVATLTAHKRFVYGLAFAPDGGMLASGSSDGTVRLWRADDGAPVATFDLGPDERVQDVAFSPDGQALVSASIASLPSSGGRLQFQPRLRLWRVADGSELRMIEHPGRVETVAFSPDGQTLASAGSYDGTVRLWRVSDGATVGVLRGPVNVPVIDVAFSPDGHILASGSYDGTVRLWRAADWAPAATLAVEDTPSVDSVAFSPDGQILAAGSSGIVRLWRLAEGAVLATLDQHPGAVMRTVSATPVAFSPDGQIIAAGSDDGTVWLWRVADRVLLTKLTGHADKVTSVAFSPDGLTLASGSLDSTVRLWRLP